MDIKAQLDSQVPDAYIELTSGDQGRIVNALGKLGFVTTTEGRGDLVYYLASEWKDREAQLRKTIELMSKAQSTPPTAVFP